MLAAVAFVAAGCVNEEPPYKEEPKPTPGDATGFLSVSGLSMRVVYDETDVRPDDTSDQTQSPQAVSGTRAEQPDSFQGNQLPYVLLQIRRISDHVHQLHKVHLQSVWIQPVL